MNSSSSSQKADLLDRNAVKIESVLFTKEAIEGIEKYYDAKFVCDSEISDVPMAIFYGKTPHPDSGSHYFGIYFKGSGENRHLMITNGQPAVDAGLEGVISDSGEVLYSHYRHHFCESKDGSVFIDGGRSYIRTNAKPNRVVNLKIKDDKLICDPINPTDPDLFS